jgi:3-oxoacyl-[acyl-carrier protein] reductase
MSTKPVMIITGTSRGIGRFLAEYYINQGFIVIGCARHESDLNNANYSHYTLDVDSESEVKQMIDFTKSDFGRIDVLINNAGTASMNHSLLTPITTVRKILDTNVIGTFLFSRECAKVMMQRKYGRIINFTTFAVPFKLEGEAIYAASKAAVITLTEILAREYAPIGITVNAVAPPAVKTDLIKGVPDEKIDKLLQRQAIHRYGTPEEVAKVIDFFIEPQNTMVTGQIIHMGGI